MGKINLPVLTIVAAVSLALLLLGQHFIFNQHNLRGLEEKFADIPGVAATAVDSTPNGLSLTLELEKETELREAYRKILNLAAEAGISFDAISIRDDRGPILSQTLYDIHYAIEEGIATGRFQLMADSVEDELAARGIDDYELWVDSQFVYLEMNYGPEHLYQVFPRGDFQLRGAPSRKG